MKFQDVVQNGVLQAHGMKPRGAERQYVGLPTKEWAKRLLKYKGERIVRSMARASGKLQIIFD